MLQKREVTALFWILRIGEGLTISEINRNSRRAWRVVRLLEDLGLARVERVGRLKVVKLTEKGERVRWKLVEVLRELNTRKLPLPRTEVREAPTPVEGELPEWLRGNPWLHVIGERGRV